MPTVAIAFSYTTDPLVVAALKEFHVFAVDPTTHARQSTTPIVVAKTAIPSISSPLVVTMNGYGSQVVEVVPVDLQGNEGATTYAPVHVNLPPVSSVAQVTA